MAMTRDLYLTILSMDSYIAAFHPVIANRRCLIGRYRVKALLSLLAR